MSKQEAMFYEKIKNMEVLCFLCPHHCQIKKGHYGICKARLNEEGRLFSVNYGEIAGLSIDPIEKKPLYHFFPGKNILSAGSFGCNLSCSFCQNYQSAKQIPPTTYMSPHDLLNLIIEAKSANSIGIAFTYNEPAISYEYIFNIAPLIKSNDLKIVMVSNGFIEKEPLEMILPYIDAFNIDLKAFQDKFYKSNCKASLEPVKESIKRIAGKSHLEITTLLIPGENDDMDEIDNLAKWLADIDPKIVLHLSRYHPAYQFEKESTPVDTLIKARKIAQKHLAHVYIGNVYGVKNDTNCFVCGGNVISRDVFETDSSGLQGNKCLNCNAEINYIVLE